MKILALDTSSTACSVALLANDKIVEQHEILPMQQTKYILPFINQLLQSENMQLNQLDAIAFGCGPGSFTGVRIATSVAQGLAYASEIALIPISSLSAIAEAAYQEFGWKKLIVAVDARMNEVYWACYEEANQLVKLKDQEKISAPQAIQLPDESQWYGVGDAWEVYDAEITAKPVHKQVKQLPTAKAILALAKERLLQGDTVPARNAMPVYLREIVAKKMVNYNERNIKN